MSGSYLFRGSGNVLPSISCLISLSSTVRFGTYGGGGGGLSLDAAGFGTACAWHGGLGEVTASLVRPGGLVSFALTKRNPLVSAFGVAGPLGFGAGP